MALNWQPIGPWHLIVTAVAGLAILGLLARWLSDPQHGLGRRRLVQILVLTLSSLAAALLALAAWNPRLVPQQREDKMHLAVILDVSDSVQRAEGGLDAIRNDVARRLDDWIGAVDAGVRARATGSVITFGHGDPVVARKRVAMAGLPGAVLSLQPGDWAVGSGTDVAAGLAAAGRQIEDAGGRGAVLLISDGNQTEGDALQTATRLARRGIPVHVYPVSSRDPEVAITSGYLASQVLAGQESYLRGVLHNSRPVTITASLSVEQNTGLGDAAGRFAAAGFDPISVPLAAQSWARLRSSIRFSGCGLQFVDLTLIPEDRITEHRRRFFTHVVEPPRLLAIGGDNEWINLLPTDAATVTEALPADLLSDTDLSGYDAVVIGTVSASEFPSGSLAALADVVEQQGLGLMVINGGHEGADEETATVLMSYDDTPLARVLPVTSHPRPFEQEPPSREIIILVDSSGSMGGGKIETARQIVRHITQKLMRTQDRLHLVTFTTGADYLVRGTPMDAGGKDAALDQINRIGSGGGTNPEAALDLIRGLDLSDCGLIFISDGEFAPVTVRPECRATVFAIGQDSVSPDSPLAYFADPIPVGYSFNPENVSIPYFEPEKRKRTFERGDYVPLEPGAQSGSRDRVPIPELSLSGAAVTYRREGSELAAVRPRFADPILVYRESGAGYVGVFTTRIPTSWEGNVEASQAVAAWIGRVVPYQARDRYQFSVTDQGDRLSIHVALQPKDRQVPDVSALEARIEIDGGSVLGLTMAKDPDAPATFFGSIDVPRTARAQPGKLVMREFGADSLARPQRIPILIPPAGSVQSTLSSEAASFGLNEALLHAVTAAGGGDFLADPGIETALFYSPRAARRIVDAWLWLVALAFVAYLAAVITRRLET